MKKSLSQALIMPLVLAGCFTGISARAEGDLSLKRDRSLGRPITSTLLQRAPQRTAAPAIATKANGARLRASVLYTDSWESTGSYKFGIYEFPAEGSYSSTPVYLNDAFDPTGGAALIGGDRYLMTHSESAYGYTFVNHLVTSTSDWGSFKTYDGNNTSISRDMAWDHVSGKLYGCFRTEDGKGWVFGTLDPDNLDKERTKISELTERWDAMSFDRIGRLYVITQSGKLCRVDKSNGAMTLIGETGLTTSYNTTGAIDPESGKFYFLPVLDQPTYLYAIDLETAQATPVYRMNDGEQLAGMYFAKEAVNASAPAVATNLSATFDHKTFKGSVSFRMPATTAGGTTASGTLTYKVYANGEIAAQGTGTYGQNITANLTLKEGGEYAFEIVTSNASGSSEGAWTSAFVGPDAPSAVESVEMINVGDRIILQWKAVTTAAHGGLIEPDEVTYTVTRYPEGKVVEQSTKATAFTEVLPEGEPMMLYYTVTPEYGSHKGAETKTTEILYGAFNTPYFADFTNSDDLKYLTIADANGDGRRFNQGLDDDNNACLYLPAASITYADDYIFSAPLNLKKGLLYRLSAIVSPRYAKYGCKENIDLVLASAADPSAVTTELLKNEQITEYKQEAKAMFKVDNDGVYYVAIHGCGSPDAFGLYAYSMEVSSDAPVTAPAAPALTAVRNGKSVKVTATVPTRLINGEEAGEITSIEIYRNDTPIVTRQAPAKGSEIVFDDNTLADGLYVYSAVASNANGNGERAEARAYIGVNIPGAPTDAVAKEHDDCRTVTVTWKAPEFDRDGCPIDASDITYTLASYNESTLKWIPAVTNIKGTSVTYKALNDGNQILVKYGVFAETSKGKNEYDMAVAPTIALGDPYHMPYIETFGGTSLTGVLGEENENESAMWQIMYNYDQDGSGGSLFYTGAKEKKGSAFTGKILIEGENPTFSFWFWSIPTSPEGEGLTVSVNDGTGYREIGHTEMNQGGDDQHWERYSVDVSEFVGKTVQFKITYLLKKYVLYIDNIRLTETYYNNLTVNSLVGFSHVSPGYTYTYVAEIENTSERQTPEYSVSVVGNDGVTYGSATVPTLEPGERSYPELKVSISPMTPADLTLTAVIDDEDENPDDNASAPMAVTVVHADVPVVTDLSATRNSINADLIWSEPVAANEFEKVTEGADRLIAFSTGSSTSKVLNDNIGDWTMINADGAGSAGLVGFEHPNIFKESDMAFIVWNPSLLGIVVKDWQPRSGLQSFVCLLAPEKANDDWMVSPLLSGKQQTVTFWAKAVNDTYTETFEFGYSTSGTATADFTMTEKVSKVPGTWTRYSYTIPAGSTHFAIRCTSNRQFALFIDDIEFERANPSYGVSPDHYIVYRDGKAIIQTPLTSYSDKTSDSHTYRVTAVYDQRGESQGSNEVTVGSNAAIGEVSVTPAPTAIGGQGYIDIFNAESLNVTVTTTDGRIVARFTAHSPEVRVALHCGIYLVSTGNATAKVIVD